MTEQVTPPRTDVVTEPKQPDKSLGQLFGELGSDLGSLVRQELDLAKVETRHELRKALQAVVSFAAAGVAGLLALIMVSEAAAWLLDQWLNTALSFLIVGLVWAVIA